MTEFESKEKMEEVCTKQIEEENDFKLEQILNRGDNEIKNKMMIIRTYLWTSIRLHLLE